MTEAAALIGNLNGRYALAINSDQEEGRSFCLIQISGTLWIYRLHVWMAM